MTTATQPREALERVDLWLRMYRQMVGIRQFEKLPKAAREYLAFIEKETGAHVGMVSTGPDREQTIFVDDFAAEMKSLTGKKIKTHA